MPDTRQEIEPAARRAHPSSDGDATAYEIELSKAISLKRIADALHDPRVAGSLHFTLSRMLDTMDRPL